MINSEAYVVAAKPIVVSGLQGILTFLYAIITSIHENRVIKDVTIIEDLNFTTFWQSFSDLTPVSKYGA